MADNLTQKGNGTVATDEVGGIHYQLIKPCYGEDGEKNMVSKVRPLPVILNNDLNTSFLGRTRVSEEEFIFNSKLLKGKESLYWSEKISGSATSVHSSVDTSVTMSVSANAESVIRQTKNRFIYEPGKKQRFIFSCNFNSGVASTTKRVGCYDGVDGCFFETNGTTFRIGISKNSTISYTNQSSFNLDTIDGNGNSGYNMDLSKIQVFVIEYLWLGASGVKFGVLNGDDAIYFHQYIANNIETSVYMTNPNLPIRYEISSSGGASSFEQICCSVSSEGGYAKNGRIISISTGTTAVDADIAGQSYPILGVRLKSDHINTFCVPKIFDIMCTTNDNFRYFLCINPTISGTFTYNDLDDSNLQYAIGTSSNEVTDDGYVILEGYESSQVRSTSSNIDLFNNISIGEDLNSNRDILCLCVTPLSPGADIYASLTLKINQ